jgi:hypothetical protein
MSPSAEGCASFWLRRIYNHNPFYVISAALVMYGLHVSFAGRLDPTQGWLLVRLLAGYALMLAGAGIAIVRLGQVWEDARTLVCLVVVILVALASSFDRACLDDDLQGAKFLAAGFSFAIALCELLIRGLKIRLPWNYRLPFYAQLALLFAYPAWLGRLSINDREHEMAWYVLGLPTLQALATLLLVPAARRRGADVANNGTPWNWPWYPWPALVLLGVAGVLRAIAMSMSFDNAQGFAAGIEPYAFIPLALAWCVVGFEGKHSGERPSQAWVAVLAPLALLFLSMPGIDGSPAQMHYLSLLRGAVGSPIQVTAILLTIYFCYLRMRGVRAAEFGLVVALSVLAVVDHSTVSLDRLAPLQLVPAAAAIALLVVGAIWRASSIRTCAAVGAVIAATYYSGFGSELFASRGYLPLHAGIAFTLLVGLAFRDAFGRWIAAAAPGLIITAAVGATIAYRFLFPTVEPLNHAAWCLALAAIAYAYRRRVRRLDDLIAIAWTLSTAAVLAAEHVVRASFAQLVLPGKSWLAWGGACFVVGLVISLVKGRQGQRLLEWLQRMNTSQTPGESG